MKIRPPFWFALAAVLVFSVWRLDLFAQPQDLGHGARFVPKRVGGVTLQLVFFEEAKATLRVLANPGHESARMLNAWGRENKALAVINGGYFEPGNMLPGGLEIGGGLRMGEFLNRGEWGGSFIVKDGKPALVWDSEFQDDPKITEMIQCSPWLISDGKLFAPPSPEGGSEGKNARTFILTDGAGHWAVGTAKNVGLGELARLLASPGVIPEFKVKRALCLDGGPSSGLWFKTAEGTEDYDKPGWVVRNGIAVIPR